MDDLAFGRGVSQATHFGESALFTIIHVSHDQVLAGALNCVPKDDDKLPPSAEEIFAAGRAVSQATHFDASDLFTTMHVLHSQVFTAALNCVPNEFNGVVRSFGSGLAGAVTVPGFGDSHAMHFTFVASFFSIQLSHSH